MEHISPVPGGTPTKFGGARWTICRRADSEELVEERKSVSTVRGVRVSGAAEGRSAWTRGA